MPPDLRAPYLATINALLTHFRTQIAHLRSLQPASSSDNTGIPLILHHVVVPGLNNHAFISPYNKLATWALGRLKNIPLPSGGLSPEKCVPEEIKPEGDFSADEIVLTKLAPSCFSSSDLLAYLRAREIRHVVLVGLTTGGSVLSSVLQGSGLDFHIIVPRGGCWDDDGEVDRLMLGQGQGKGGLVGRFADVVEMEDVLKLGS
jgi:nicotinamidase-related amidase